MRRGLPRTSTHFLIGFPELKMGGFVTVHVRRRTPSIFTCKKKVKLLNKKEQRQVADKT